MTADFGARGNKNAAMNTSATEQGSHHILVTLTNNSHFPEHMNAKFHCRNNWKISTKFGTDIWTTSLRTNIILCLSSIQPVFYKKIKSKHVIIKVISKEEMPRNIEYIL
jgi:hypothetical protein